VQDADFFYVKYPILSGVPAFALHDVARCNIRAARGLMDMSIDKAADKAIYAN
jgi:hypothetical protein